MSGVRACSDPEPSALANAEAAIRKYLAVAGELIGDAALREIEVAA